MQPTPFRDRKAAGQLLADRLMTYAHRSDVLVLGLPRGGVPVAFEVAKALNAALDVYVVRKLGVPGHEELAMGAIAANGVRVLNDDVIAQLRIPPSIIEVVAVQEQRELERRERMYRRGRRLPPLAGRTVILVDDGLATGSTMRAAVAALRGEGLRALVVAVPVAARETCDRLRDEVAELVCLRTPEPFLAVGHWYLDFSQTGDDEVRRLLAEAAAPSLAERLVHG